MADGALLQTLGEWKSGNTEECHLPAGLQVIPDSPNTHSRHGIFKRSDVDFLTEHVFGSEYMLSRQLQELPAEHAAVWSWSVPFFESRSKLHMLHIAEETEP